MKSWKTPTPEQVNKAIALLGHVEQYRYFFDQLKNPEWIKPLKRKDFFNHPPVPIEDKIRGTIVFPPWPASKYLARMATLKPELIWDIILQIPDDRGNVRVFEDMADAVLNMPLEFLKQLKKDQIDQLLEKAKTWMKFSDQTLLPNKLGALIVNLANAGQADAALNFAEKLLEILPDPKSQTEYIYPLSPQPRARFDVWDYEQIINEVYPYLLKTKWIQALKLICDKLEDAIKLSRRHDEDQNDYSYIWRPAIENHDQNQPSYHELTNVLVTNVRDMTKRLIEIDVTRIPEIIKALEQRSWKIFHRIALYLLREFGDSALDIVSGSLTNRELFNDPNFIHEYALLIGEYFEKLHPDNQKTIFRWIEQGPEIDKYKKLIEQNTGKQLTDEEALKHKKLWQRDQLAWFKEKLPDDWKRFYQSLVTEYGKPEHPEFASYTTSWSGPNSPKSAEELQGMSVDEIVAFLKTWQPANEYFTPSPEGLGRILSSVVSQYPERFADEAIKFQDIDPTYIRALILGLHDTFKQERSFKWPPVLALCNWVITQPSEIPERKLKEGLYADPDWGWARKSIAMLFSDGFKEGSSTIPFDQRASVWNILQILTEDPDPTPQDETKYIGPSMDPATLSINTTRGEAMHAVIRYALWVRRNLEKLSISTEHVIRNFHEMPEVRDVLDLHLDVLREPALAIRSIYGQWYPWLVLLDQDWAKDQASRIFPLHETQSTFYKVAWETYLIFCKPYDNVFGILKEQYEHAVDHLLTEEKEQNLLMPDRRLAEHLMTFYGRGKLDFNEEQDIIPRFWINASSTLREYAMEFIGRSLEVTKGVVSPEILIRFQKLWEKRLAVAKVFNESKSEMVSFGWWFISGKFDDKWSILQLVEALKISGKIKLDRMVVNKLANLVQKLPMETIKCLELMINGDVKGWRIYGWSNIAKLILGATLQTSAAQDAERIINYLGSRGYLEFRDLLKKA